MTIGSILPKAFEPIRTQFRVSHRVRDVLVPEVLLDRARVLAVAGELEPARMPQHVRMDRCSGSHLKPAGLAFSAGSSSD